MNANSTSGKGAMPSPLRGPARLSGGDKRGANRILLGMSGGIDSSAAALMLQDQGYEVVGLTLLTYKSEEASPWVKDARELTGKLGIEHHVIDSRKAFKRDVIDYFVNSYLKGETPNPCIRCNEVIKWKFLLDLSEKFNCNHISTGHYVRLAEKDGLFYIQKGVDPAKDQSYYLWNIGQDVLQKAVFPLGSFTKEEIKEYSEKNGFLRKKKRKESMGVCFLQNRDYRDYLRSVLPAGHPALKKGDIVDAESNVIGKHDGFPFYTIGQKRHIENLPPGHCVTKIIADKNLLVTGKRDKLFSKDVSLKTFRITPDASLWKNKKVFIRIRGIDKVPGYFGTIEKHNATLHVSFDQPVWALTPGQSLVFYHDDMVIGGGIV